METANNLCIVCNKEKPVNWCLWCKNCIEKDKKEREERLKLQVKLGEVKT